MNLDNDIIDAMFEWRHAIHAHPETAYAEHKTADLIARELQSMGIEIHRGLAKTGVVGSLTNGVGPSVGLRADMDALFIHELGEKTHASRHAGKMHACGHDGHIAMLLGAAMHLARKRDFQGTLHFIFQPAEEAEAGGKTMIEEGLFKLFPCDSVYGLHNWPALPTGQFAVIDGPVMAALDTFEILVRGRGAHAAMPEQGIDPFIVAAEIILALQTIPSRRLSALESAIVSVTQVHGGESWNVIPETVLLRGTARCFQPNVQDTIERAMRELAGGIARANNAEATVTYNRCYPPTVNSAREAQTAVSAARTLVGNEKVKIDCLPSMAGEDFAFMLRERPGAYIWLGTGVDPNTAPLHSPYFDFNDEVLALGAEYWIALSKLVCGKTCGS